MKLNEIAEKYNIDKEKFRSFLIQNDFDFVANLNDFSVKDENVEPYVRYFLHFLEQNQTNEIQNNNTKSNGTGNVNSVSTVSPPSSPAVCGWLTSIGWLTILGGIIAGLISCIDGAGIGIGIVIIVTGIISGILFLSLSNIVSLLNIIAYNTRK